MLEECENLEEVETFLQTRTHDGVTHKDANYIMAILDQRKKFVAHERFQYVLLKKFGESDIGVSETRPVLVWTIEIAVSLEVAVGNLFTVFKKLEFKLASLEQTSFNWADTCALQSFLFVACE